MKKITEEFILKFLENLGLDENEIENVRVIFINNEDGDGDDKKVAENITENEKETLVKKTIDIYLELCQVDIQLFKKLINEYLQNKDEALEETIADSIAAAVIGVIETFESPEKLVEYLKKNNLQVNSKIFVKYTKSLVEYENILNNAYEIFAKYKNGFDVDDENSIDELLEDIEMLVSHSAYLLYPLNLSLEKLEDPETIAKKFYLSISNFARDIVLEIKKDIQETEDGDENEIEIENDTDVEINENIKEAMDKIIEEIAEMLEKNNSNIKDLKNSNEQLIYSDDKIEIIYDASIPKFKIKSKIPIDVEYDPNFEPEFPKSKEIEGDLDV